MRATCLVEGYERARERNRNGKLERRIERKRFKKGREWKKR